MDWNELKTFLAVSENASFSRASEQLFISQPAVTKRIQALENRLGTKLFDRVGKRVFLTRSGELLRPRASRLVAELEDTQTLMQNLGGCVSGTLPLATSHHIGLHRMAPVLKQFSRQYPEVQLDIRFVDSELAHDLVRRADVELAVVTLNPSLLSGSISNLESQLIWHDPLSFVVGQSHPLGERALRGDSVEPKELLAYPAILPGLNTFTGQIVARAFSALGLDLEPGMSTNYLETIAMLVEIGLGWSVLPQSMLTTSASECGEAVRMLSVNLNTQPLARQLGSVINPERTRSNAAQAFSQVLKRHMDSKSQD